jgi:anti-sigma factor RsiW
MSHNHLTPHLTDEQMAQLLDHSAGTLTQQHLLTCARCQAEVTELRAALTGFRVAATGLAAAETPALRLRPPAAAPAALGFRRYAWAASFATVAAMLALSVSLLQPAHSGGKAVPPAVAAVTNAPAVSDEALLDGIQQDLSTSIPPSLEPLAVPATHN